MTMAATRKRSHPNPTTSNGKSSSADDGNETVERIIQAAESRDGSSRESSIATASSNNNNKMDTVEGGPFTNAELSQLSLLRVDGWNEVEGDTLLTLTGMLQLHIGSGVGIDLVGEGRNVVLMRKGDGPVISVQQVRSWFSFV